MNKESTVYIHTGKFFSVLKEKQSWVMCRKMDAAGDVIVRESGQTHIGFLDFIQVYKVVFVYVRK